MFGMNNYFAKSYFFSHHKIHWSHQQRAIRNILHVHVFYQKIIGISTAVSELYCDPFQSAESHFLHDKLKCNFSATK